MIATVAKAAYLYEDLQKIVYVERVKQCGGGRNLSGKYNDMLGIERNSITSLALEF